MDTIKLHYATPIFHCLTLTFPVASYDEKLETWFDSAANRYVYSRYAGDDYKKKIAMLSPLKALTWGGTDKGSTTLGATKENPKWEAIKKSIFIKANRAKYTQNTVLQDVLLSLNPKKHKLVDPYERKNEPSLVETLWKLREEFAK